MTEATKAAAGSAARATTARAPHPYSNAELRRRRRALLKALGDESVLLVPAAPEVIRNRDVHHPYRQSSDLTWLTGFPEPEAVAVLAPKRKDGAFVLFCRARDPEREVWDGFRHGVEGARAHFGADQAFPITELDERLPEILGDRRRVVYPLGHDDGFDRRVIGWLRAVRALARKGIGAPSELVSSDPYLHERRLIKSKAELKLMRRAAAISAAAHQRLMQTATPGCSEQRLEATFLAACAEQGARFQAYPPIVGSGVNACVLHYVENADVLSEGDLVLVDAGCELHGYASDITRTFPANGRFSAPQRRLYELVLAAQQAAIAKVRPGKHWNQPHQAALKVLTRGLVELGLITGEGVIDGVATDLKQLIKDERYKPFFMHKTGHWLGMDVHDVGQYKQDGQWRRFEPGMVLTVEPGLYIAPDAEAPAEYRGIGIRIEDDVLVTEGEPEVLSAGVPKDPDAIEALMAASAPDN
ncbi:aminopeptidase P N-terminal domain-containing protein [Halochromatium salexigens]|uniref:Xaa-Pro aminopeptidase n=1 Tax=Halochromatium salexigens TaxID=49447 RepID=A0AAJ0UCY8_HALSE|nr:aminopeptidase P N-terminal domain-containing protein [Halochromatium salexigens]MBK5929231.1 Xaa-Pro aminopeptidase [Halochromatium salexigens]